MGYLVTRGANAERRQRYAESLRSLCALPVALEPDCPWPAQLMAVERGETVLVYGWALGEVHGPDDWQRYWLDAAGRLTLAT